MQSARTVKQSSNRNFSNKNSHGHKPNSFRVMLKSKSGLIEQDDKKSTISRNSNRKNSDALVQANIKQTRNGGQEDIKNFVRQMRNKTESAIIVIDPQIEDNERITKNASNLENKHPLSKSKTLSVQQRPLNLKNTFSSFYDSGRKKVSIDQLEKKIDRLIQQKLSKTGVNNNTYESHSEQIDFQIQQIIRQIQRECSQPDNEEKLQNINKKIDILEKIMAENMAQSQLAKKYYFKQVHTRKTKKPLLNKYKYDLTLLKNKIKNLLNENNNFNSTVNLESTNRLSFRAPDKNSYPEKLHKSTYKFRNQPIHRSSYGRDFLVFGSVPSYPFKQPPSQIIPPITVGNRHSNYQNQFTSKKIQRINFKQLDCYRDKYKNLQVQFGQAKRLQNPSKTLTQFPQEQSRRRLKTDQSHYISNLPTQNKSNYKGEGNNIISSIKHKNLYSLKYAFKATIHA